MVPTPTRSNTLILRFLERLTLPKRLQSFSTAYTQPTYPPSLGLAKLTTSPGLPARIGVAIPTVNFLETVASPCKNRLFDSTLFVVTLLLTTTGPLNSEVALLSDPPSTQIERVADISVTSETFNPGVSLISSPVIDLTGVSNISSLPVIVLSFLLPAYEIP